MDLNVERRRGIIQWAVVGALALAATLLFLELAEDIWLKEGFAWDAPVMLAIHKLSTPWLDWLMEAVSGTAGRWITAPLTAAAVYFLWRREWLISAVVLVGYGGAMGFNSLLKLLFARPRPSVFPPLVVESSFSFPSGHTMSAVAFYGLLSLLLWRRGKPLPAAAAGLWVPLVALSRVYLGVHFPSDVLASLAVGTVYLIVLLMILRYGEAGPPAVPPRQGQGPGQARAEDCRRRKSSGAAYLGDC